MRKRRRRRRRRRRMFSGTHTHTDGCTMIEDVVVRLYPSSYLPLGCRRRESELLNMEQEFGRGWVAFGTDGKRENKE